MKKFECKFSVLKYKNEVINVIPIDDELYQNIQHIIDLTDLKPNDKTKLLNVVYENTDKFTYSGINKYLNLGEHQVRFYDKHLVDYGIEKFFKHEIVTKNINF